MGISGTCEWQGEQEVYDFDVYEIGNQLPEDPGVYIYAFFTVSSDRWVPLYVGQTNDLDRRSQEHEQEGDRFMYATHIHFFAEPDGSVRDEIEEDLITGLDPVENRTT